MSTMNIPPSGDNMRRVDAHMAMFKVSAAATPAMNVEITSGVYLYNGTQYIEYSGGSTADLTAPSTGAKWVVITINNVGAPTLVDGTESASTPDFPVIPKGSLPLAAVYMQSTSTTITSDMVFDLRPIFYAGVYPTSHTELVDRTASGSHTIGAVTDLQSNLDNKVNTADLASILQAKADEEGTTSDTFSLNKDITGVPSSNAYLTVERGSSADVSVRWNESSSIWEYTNDGTTYSPLGGAGAGNASEVAKGITQLSVAAADPATPIAVGSNDTRVLTQPNHDSLVALIGNVYTTTEIDTSLSGKEDSVAWDAVTTNGSIAAGSKSLVDTTASVLTLTTSASPVVGDEFEIVDSVGNFAINTLTISPNGSNINGAAPDLVANTQYQRIRGIYVGGATGWIIKSA